jgi:hypothetical protein
VRLASQTDNHPGLVRVPLHFAALDRRVRPLGIPFVVAAARAICNVMLKDATGRTVERQN